MQVKVLKGVVQTKFKAIYRSTKRTEAHWLEKCTAVELTRAAERCKAQAKLEEASRNGVAQRARAARAVKTILEIQERVKKLMTKRDRLTARFEELSF